MRIGTDKSANEMVRRPDYPEGGTIRLAAYIRRIIACTSASSRYRSRQDDVSPGCTRRAGQGIVRKKFSRKQLLAYTANLQPVADRHGSLLGSTLHRRRTARARDTKCG